MQTVTHKNSHLYYQKIGYGPKTLLAFHGFGQDHKAFDLLGESLKEQYTIYSFDLYFHGKSEWGYAETPLEKEFLKEVIQKFQREHSLQTFSLVGFSLGCRFVLALAEQFSNDVDKIFLIAPDGIKTSFWFTLSTYPIVLRKLFKSMIHHPARFKAIVNTLYKIKIMDKGLLKFAEHQMNTEEKRKRVYYSWVVFRHLKFKIKNLVDVINERDVSVTIVVGVHDRVIKPSSMKKFTKRLHNVNLKTLNNGHAALLKDPNLVELFKE